MSVHLVKGLPPQDQSTTGTQGGRNPNYTLLRDTLPRLIPLSLITVGAVDVELGECRSNSLTYFELPNLIFPSTGDPTSITSSVMVTEKPTQVQSWTNWF